MSSTDSASAPRSELSPARTRDDAKLNVPKRAHTFQSGTDTERTSPFDAAQADQPDAHEPTDNDDPGDAARASVDMGELPIELISLTDR